MIRVIALGVLLVGGAASAGSDEPMHIDVSHPFSREVARERAQMLFDYWHKAYGVQCTWDGDRAHVAGRVMGINVNAMLVVTERNIGGDAEDPGPFVRGFARSYITRKLQKYMHPQYVEP